MMMANDPEVRMKYLSLALFAQRVIDALIEFITEGKREPMETYVKEAVGSLENLSARRHNGGASIRAIRYYEQVRTIDEISKPNELEAMLSVLKALQQRGGIKKERQRLNAEKAIEFFYKLEKQALLNCNRPNKPLPRGIRELCKAP